MVILKLWINRGIGELICSYDFFPINESPFESRCFPRLSSSLRKDRLIYDCHDREASGYRDWKVINKNITLVSNDIHGMSIKIRNLAGFEAE